MATYDPKTGRNTKTGSYSKDSVALGVAPKGASVDSSTKLTVRSGGGGSSSGSTAQSWDPMTGRLNGTNYYSADSIALGIAPKGSQVAPGSVQTVRADTLGAQPGVAPVPSYKPTDFNGLLASAFAPQNQAQQYDAQGKPVSQEGAYNAGGLAQLMASLQDTNPAPKMADIYAEQQRVNGIRQKEQAVADYSSQLNAIQARSQADQLRVTGQGRGIPEVIIGGQQSQIAKEAAIQALPVAAQLAAAQNNLQLAQQHADTMFKVLSQDAQNQFEHKNKLIDSVMQFANNAEQRRLQQYDTAAKQAFDIQQQNISLAHSYVNNALSTGQSKLAADIMRLAGTPSSTTFSSDLAGLVGRIQAPSSGASAPTIKSINGVDMQWNPATGQWELPSGVDNMPEPEESYRSQLATTGRQAVRGLQDIATQHPDIFGKSAALWLPDSVRSDAFRNYKSQLDFLKGNIIPSALTAMREASKTGGALGQVSDREGAWLANSLGSLDMSQSPDMVIKQLRDIDTHLAAWQDAVVAHGGGGGYTITAPDGSGDQIQIID